MFNVNRLPIPQKLLRDNLSIPGGLTQYLVRYPTHLLSAVEALFFGLGTETCIGISLQLTQAGKLHAAAFCIGDKVLVVDNLFLSRLKEHTDRQKESQELLKQLCSNESAPLAGFNIGRIVMHLRVGLGVHASGVDISSIFTDKKPASPGQCFQGIVCPTVDSFVVDELWESVYLSNNEDNGQRDLMLRAWISFQIANPHRNELLSKTKVRSTNVLRREFQILYESVIESDCMDAVKPRVAQNEFDSVEDKGGIMIVQNSRFKTRIRASATTKVVFTDHNGEEYYGSAIHGYGRSTTVTMQRHINSGANSIKSIKVIGKEEATLADRARDEFILKVLQAQVILPKVDLIRMIWLPRDSEKPDPPKSVKVGSQSPFGILNESQSNVVNAMTDTSTYPIIIVHGPPGTGKTTTILHAVRQWTASLKRVWLVAQSNVGVKIIAESLKSHGVEFKLIVSREFYEEWHEHIYKNIEGSIVHMDTLLTSPVEIYRTYEDVPVMVVLCTLSNLSNPSLPSITKLVPVEHLVVDEASQISLFDFMHLFSQFKELKKVCFFGDPKQLPPYGKETVPSMKCIFDVKHFKPAAYFLNTQYRMPIQIGEFISEHVYDGKLRSQHSITSPNCLAFVDVDIGVESPEDKSWKNEREAQSVVHLVKNYYHSRDFCVITPYDAQRNLIQNLLKRDGLPWEKVFNVDSFQGHEAQFVIISVVRTERPGFLNFQNRNNVMLTRCKSGMVIVAKKSFLKDRASETLLGKLVVYWDKKASWIGWRDVAAGHVELPGFTRVKTVCTPIQTTRISQTVKQKQVRTSQSITRQSSPLIVSQWPALVRDDMKGTIGAGVQVSTGQVQKTSLPPNVNKLRVNPHPTVIRTGRGPWASTGKLKLVENNEGNLVDSYDSLRWPSLKQSNTEGGASVGVSSGQVQTTSLPPNVNVVTPSPYPTVRRTGWGPWTSPGGLGLPGNNGEDLDAFIGSLKQKKRRK